MPSNEKARETSFPGPGAALDFVGGRFHIRRIPQDVIRASIARRYAFFFPIERSRFRTMPTVAAVAMAGSCIPKIGIMPFGKP